ncbi:hypothetical protein [Halobacterium noricense]|uniref:hypothetical protein n=1 Tax=Halobacterium noricense TaxID=223182 RepID=UPI001E32C34E|nr:hypothetical protein [Halobacterium noricense]UHH25396.1 hypothetical protein LT974_00260 [Halobacterium noricense]
MADLPEYQEQVIETISTLDDVPMALLYYAPNGPEMFLQNDHRNRDDVSPHVGLLAAYTIQVAQDSGNDTSEILHAVDEKIHKWADDGVAITAEERGGPDFDGDEE